MRSFGRHMSLGACLPFSVLGVDMVSGLENPFRDDVEQIDPPEWFKKTEPVVIELTGDVALQDVDWTRALGLLDTRKKHTEVELLFDDVVPDSMYGRLLVTAGRMPVRE